MLVAVVCFGISANAQSSSCSYISGAYVVAEATMEYPGTGSSNKYIKISVTAYEIETGAVNYEVKFSDTYQGEQTKSGTISFSKQRDGSVKGSFDLYGIAPTEIKSLRISNASCKCSN